MPTRGSGRRACGPGTTLGVPGTQARPRAFEDPTMDCRQFRKQHAYFIDDMLSGVATWEMRDHLAGCGSCSRFDTQLRRSLLVARRIPTLEASKDFQRRLNARLAAEKLARPPFNAVVPPRKNRGLPLLAATAAAVAISFGTIGLLRVPAPESTPLPAVTTVQPPVQSEVPKTQLASPPVAAQPVYPAMLLAQRATEQLAASQARAASVRATH